LSGRVKPPSHCACACLEFGADVCLGDAKRNRLFMVAGRSLCAQT
jgi:hypothetical protein